MRSALAANGFVPPAQGYEAARSAAKKALALDPNLARAHNAMAKILIEHDWDWSAAQKHVDLALQLDPGNSSSLVWGAILADTTGNFEQAIELSRKALAVNPLDPQVALNLARVLYRAGQLPQAQQAIEQALRLNPGVPLGHLVAGQVQLAMGKPQAALAQTEQDQAEDARIFGQALAYYALARKPEADAAIANYEKKFGNDDPYEIAAVHAYRGEADQAFTWLERARLAHEEGCGLAKADPLLRGITKDPRFADFLRKMNLPV
jgi:Tfp pilus assembly protein PilF